MSITPEQADINNQEIRNIPDKIDKLTCYIDERLSAEFHLLVNSKGNDYILITPSPSILFGNDSYIPSSGELYDIFKRFILSSYQENGWLCEKDVGYDCGLRFKINKDTRRSKNNKKEVPSREELIDLD